MYLCRIGEEVNVPQEGIVLRYKPYLFSLQTEEISPFGKYSSI